MFFEQYDHEPAIAVARFWLAYSGRPEAFVDRSLERTDSAAIARSTPWSATSPARRAYLVGDALTLADIALYAYTHVAHEGGFDLDSHPAIRDGSTRVAASRATWRSTRRNPWRATRRRRCDTVAGVSVRVRFAPSPTGSLHLGNALTAVANRRFADERDGALVLRIDDTDAARTIVGGEQACRAV